ncbi:TonB-dependent siderophore receptor [uncultured Ferrimonas sp.]|uniref:TonB-dependent siderophore receptor n=1 Tax=uncultured Ferrimonas sp. TaxID=432640 RepID=UPI00260CBE33|nr:TonB-dependent siderophore receptor [uncultured Ferrimonas sp.]
MKVVAHSAVATAIALALSAPAYAAETAAEDIERIEVVGQLSFYSATKSATPIMETARSISVETDTQLIEKGALRLDDAFTYTAGVNGETYGYATRGDWVRIRGFEVPQYRDSLQSLFGNNNNTRPDVYALEQVEALKGPASVLYGKGSPGGLINLVSKTPKQESAHELVLEYGSFDHKQLALDSTGQLSDDGQWLYRMVGLYRDTETQVDFVEDNTVMLAPSLTWQPNDNNQLTLLLNYTDTDSDTAAQFLPVSGTLHTAPNGQKMAPSTYVGDPDYNQYLAETLSVTLIGEHYFNDDWSASFTGRYTDASVDYQQAWISFIPSATFIGLRDGSLHPLGLAPRSFYRKDGTSEQAAIDLRLRGNVMLAGMEHELLFGTQYQDVTIGSAGYFAFAVGLDFTNPLASDDSYWINPFNPSYGNVPPAAALDAAYAVKPDTDSKDLGIYISDQISYESWLLTLGLRFDDTETTTASDSQSDDEVSFSAGLMYQFDVGLSPYASYAESFDPVVGDNGAGKALQPMRGEQWELGLKYQPEGWPAMVQLAYFDIEQSNLNDPNAQPGNVEQQSGVAEVTGVELEAMGRIGDVTVELNASVLDHNDANGNKLASVPEQQASAWISYQPSQFDGFRSGLGARYVGESFGGTESRLQIYDNIRTPSYTLVDLMIGYQWQQVQLQLNARNLFDKQYYATCLARGDCFAGDERTIVGSLRYAF